MPPPSSLRRRALAENAVFKPHGVRHDEESGERWPRQVALDLQF
jgi:hypothetical protein